MILENIMALCKREKISVYRLEKEAGIGNGTIGRWKESTPNMSSLKRVADYFGVTVDELMQERDQKAG